MGRHGRFMYNNHSIMIHHISSQLEQFKAGFQSSNGSVDNVFCLSQREQTRTDERRSHSLTRVE